MNTTTTDSRDESVLSKLGKRTRATIEALLSSPMAEKALAQTEAESLENRKRLAAELAAHDAEEPAFQKEWVPKSIAAYREYEAAEAAWRAAQEKKRAHDVACYSAEMVRQQKRGALTGELENTADSRLQEFAAIASSIASGPLVAAEQFWMGGPVNELRVMSNHDRIRVACDALLACERDLLAKRLEPMTYAEVSQVLMQACVDLAPVLAEFKINPPSLTAKDAEVGDPISWRGRSEWVTDAVHHPTNEERAVMARERRAKVEATAQFDEAGAKRAMRQGFGPMAM